MADTKDRRIMWNDEEWFFVASELAKIDPVYLLDRNKPIFPDHLRRVMALLPEARRRRVNPNGGSNQFKPRIHEELDKLRDPALVGSTTYEASSNVHKTPREAALASGANPKNAPRTMWKASEYLQMALYLRKRYPGQSYLESSEAVGLSLDDLREAQRAALPPHRQRELKNITPLRAHMAVAFKEAKKTEYQRKEQAEREAQQARQEEQRKAAEKAAERAAADVAALTTPPTPEAPFPLYQPEAGIPASNPYEAAFAPLLRPLMRLLAQEFAAALIPTLLEQAMPALKQALGAPHTQTPQTPAQTPAAPVEPSPPKPDEARPPQLTLASPPKLRRPKIGIMGLLPIQANQVAAAFPGIEFICRDDDQTSAFNGCERVMGMIKFLPHPREKALIRNYGDRYVRINGAVSDAKRTIQLWINQGIIKAQQAA